MTSCVGSWSSPSSGKSGKSGGGSSGKSGKSSGYSSSGKSGKSGGGGYGKSGKSSDGSSGKWSSDSGSSGKWSSDSWNGTDGWTRDAWSPSPTICEEETHYPTMTPTTCTEQYWYYYKGECIRDGEQDTDDKTFETLVECCKYNFDGDYTCPKKDECHPEYPTPKPTPKPTHKPTPKPASKPTPSPTTCNEANPKWYFNVNLLACTNEEGRPGNVIPAGYWDTSEDCCDAVDKCREGACSILEITNIGASMDGDWECREEDVCNPTPSPNPPPSPPTTPEIVETPAPTPCTARKW